MTRTLAKFLKFAAAARAELGDRLWAEQRIKYKLLNRMDRLHIDIDLFREPDDHRHILVCFAIDYHAEQRHLLQSTTVPVSAASIKECLTKIVSRIVEGSIFNDADPPGTAPAVPSPKGQESASR
jgi:hypothetical protein